MGNSITSSKYDSKSSIIDNIMNTNNLKLNKILQNTLCNSLTSDIILLLSFYKYFNIFHILF